MDSLWAFLGATTALPNWIIVLALCIGFEMGGSIKRSNTLHASRGTDGRESSNG